jgi:hypothetical protein
VTGYDRQTLMNMVYVATRFETSRRRENLSWSHHAEVAGLDAAEQERWLERAGADRLTVRELRLELHCAKRQLAAAQSNGHATNGDRPHDEGDEAPKSKSAAHEANGAPAERPSRRPRTAVSAVFTCPHCGGTFHEDDCRNA